MQIRFKGGLRTRTEFGLVKPLETALRRITAIRLDVFREGIPAGLFSAGYLPYEASETYRTIKTEFERNRLNAMMEVRKQTLRGA
jgi:hypothetical protein